MMKNLLALIWFTLSIGGAQAQSIGPTGGSSGITAGTTTVTGCTALNLFYDNTGVMGCMAGTSWDDTNRSLTITGATVTTSAPIISATQTWNNAGVVFDGIKYTITNLASSSNSLPFNFTAGTSFMRFRIDGSLRTNAGFDALADGAWFRLGGSSDVLLMRDAAASLRLGFTPSANPVAQSIGVQRASGTDTAAAATFTLVGPLATGNALPGDIILQTGAIGDSGATVSTATTALTIKGGTQDVIAAAQLAPGTTTVAGLASLTGVEGGLINVSDQLTVCPVKGGTFTGGGAVTCLAHFEEGAWVAP